MSIRMPESLNTQLGYAATRTYRSKNQFICRAIANEIHRVYKTEPQDTVLTSDHKADNKAMIEAEKAAHNDRR